MECGGNLYDAVSLAVKSALYATQIPTVKVAAMDGDQPELELSDDPYDTKSLNTLNAPCLVTLMKVCPYKAMKDIGTIQSRFLLVDRLEITIW